MTAVDTIQKSIILKDEQSSVLIEKTEELRLLFEKAETAIKMAERSGNEVVIPAVNQLRYAGYHTVTYLNAHFNERIDHIERAKKHCKRAILDTVEASIMLYLAEIRNFEKDFKSIEISSVISDYLEKKKIVREISRKVTPAHGDEEKLKLFEALKQDVEKLREINDSFEDARDELNKKLKKERREYFLKVSGLIVAVVGVIAGVIKIFS